MNFIEKLIEPLKEKTANRIIAAIAIAVPTVVTILHYLHKPDNVPAFINYCPLVNAILNGTCTVFLIGAFIFILNKKVQIHRTLNGLSFIMSIIFLISYILYHYFTKETLYPKDNPLRPLYIFLLSSHILCAAIVLPMILKTLYFEEKKEYARHKKLARWTLPIWLYVTITGVVVYLMISPYYNF